MSQQHTYAEVAADWSLWNQFVNTDAAMARDEFDALSIPQRVALQVEAFGPEAALHKFEVYNRVSGHSFGIYEAASEEAAIEACYRDAGYSSKAAAEEVMGHDSNLVAVEVEAA